MNKLDYPYLRAWDRMMASSQAWTEQQLRNARADDAIYADRNFTIKVIND